jgi:hypothetical protein
MYKHYRDSMATPATATNAGIDHCSKNRSVWAAWRQRQLLAPRRYPKKSDWVDPPLVV